jgi:hypothetical protein
MDLIHQKIENSITVEDLIKHLNGYPLHFKIYFGGLDFYRLKQRGENFIQMEFNQPVYLDAQGNVVVENP